MLNILAGVALVFIGSPATAYADTIQPSFLVAEYSTTTEGLIARYSAFYEVSEASLAAVIACESKGNPKAWNKTDPQGGAKGIAQFLQPTFDTWSKRAGIKSGDVWDKEDSIKTMAYMWSMNQQSQWTCYHVTHGKTLEDGGGRM